MSVAQLGLAVDSSPAKRAAVDLDALTQSAERVENATKRATASASQNASATGALAARLQGVATANDNATAAINRHVLAIQNLTAAEGRLGADAYASRAADVAAYGTALDGLRAKFNPVFSAIQQYRATLGEIRQAHAVGAIGVNEMTAAIDRERSATLRAIEAAKGLKAAQERASGPSAGARQAAGFNAGQQLQDIAMMSALGQSPGALALQQGPQLATAIQQGGGLATLGAGLAQVFSLTTLITVGAVAATAATVQWFMKGKDGANDMADALAKNNKAVKDLADAYKLAGFNADELGKKTIVAAEAQERISRRELERQIMQSGKDIQSATSPSDFMTFGLLGGARQGDVDPRFAAFSGPILAFRKAMAEGKADFATLEKIQNDIEAIAGAGYGPFRAFVDDMARMAGLKPEGIRETADELQSIIANAAEATRRLEQLQNLNRNGRGDRVGGPNRMDAAAEAGRRILEQQRRERELQFQTDEEQFQAGLQTQRARTNAERLAAAERTARAAGGDTNADVRARRAVAEERTRQEVEARDAATQRSQAMARTLQQQRDELDLIGKTAGEQAKLRFEFERMQELRDQAARTGDPIDDKEVEKINAAAKAMGLYADALARARLRDDLGFEARQLGRSDIEQSVAGRLRQSGLGEDLNGPQAAMIRSNELLKKQVDLWKDVRKSGMDAYSDIFDLAFDGFDNWQERLSDIAKDMAKNIFDLSIKNPFLNEQYGANLPTMDQAGGLSGFIGTLFGMTPNPAAGLGQLGSAANPMYVVPVGGLGGGADAVTRMFSPANSNLKATDYAPMSLSGIGSPGSLASNAPYSVANATSFIEKYAAAIGIDPGIALKVARSEGLGAGIWQSNYSKGGFREPSFGPFQLLKGGQGTGFGTGLGNRFMAQTGLDPADPANWQKSTAFALDQAKAGGWGPWYGAKNQGITGFMGIDRSAKSAVGALERLTAGTMDAGKGLNVLGGGMDKLGNLLSKFPAAPSGGGGGGLLGNLFGGLSSAFSGTGAFKWLSANPGGSIGLYADGTENAPEGWAWVGERGPELRKLRAGDVIRSNPRSMEMAANARGGAPSKTEMHFHNAPAVAHQQESDDGEGGKRMDIWFEQQTAKAASRRGSAASKALASMGLTRPMKVR